MQKVRNKNYCRPKYEMWDGVGWVGKRERDAYMFVKKNVNMYNKCTF